MPRTPQTPAGEAFLKEHESRVATPPTRSSPTQQSKLVGNPEDPSGNPEDPIPEDPLKAFIDVFHEDWQALPLAAKLAKIGGTLGNIPKKGFNRAQNYRYARETDLVAAIRPYLSAAGILITFSMTEHEVIPRTSVEAKGMLTHIRLHWVVTDGKESLEGDMDGYGMDTGDKGVFKAITGAKKYILMTLFLIDTGDDPEVEAAHDKPEQVHRSPQRVAMSDIVLGDNGDEPAPPPVVSPLRRTDIVRGGHTTEATDTQINRLIAAVRDKGWSARQLLAFVRVSLGAALIDAPEEDPDRLRAYITQLLDSLSPSDMGQLLVEIERE